MVKAKAADIFRSGSGQHDRLPDGKAERIPQFLRVMFDPAGARIKLRDLAVTMCSHIQDPSNRIAVTPVVPWSIPR